MNYHLFQKGSQSVFSKKKKKIKSKSQNRERMPWTLYTFPLHCIVSYKVRIYPNFTAKVACICIPQNHVNYVDSLHLNVQIFWIWDDWLSRWVDLLLSHKDGPSGTSTLVFRGLHVLANRGLHALTLRGLCVLTFRGLHVLTFRGLHALAIRGLRVLTFRGLHALAMRGLHVLTIRGLHALTSRGLHVLALRGLHALTLHSRLRTSSTSRLPSKQRKNKQNHSSINKRLTTKRLFVSLFYR